MNKPKIIHISAWAKTFTQFKMPILKGLKKMGYEQTIFCPNDTKHIEKLMDENFNIVIGDVCSALNIKVGKQIINLYNFIKREKFSILIGHQPMGALIGISAAYFARIPIKIYATGGLKFNPTSNSLINVLLKYGELKIIRMSDAVLVINREDEQALKKIPYVNDKIYYIGPRDGCGIDTNKFNVHNRLRLRNIAREELGIDNNIFVVGYTGRCVWEKGFKEIIDAIFLINKKNIRFLIVGDGHHMEKIKDYAKEKGVNSQFIFLGYKFNIDYYMSAFDIFILPSYREGMPVSLLEAMAFGIPSIATNIRGNRELIIDGKTGILLPVKNASKLAEAILYFKNNPNNALIMGTKGAEYIFSNFSEDTLLDKTLNLINRLIEMKGL